MSLRETLEEDIVTAMRGRDQARLNALRFLKSAIQLEEKAQQKPLDDAAVLQVVVKQVNDRREAIRMFKEGNRDDLVAKESGDLKVLEAYLPPQMSHDDLVELVQQVIGEVGATSGQDKGKVMGKLMPQVRGKADGAEVNALVVQMLESAG
ncbi:MAG: hypothetical protein BZY81_05740 [SAR202 cluster bacterium Io17-Chloro-G4]|nr:MAG: hypothetical protein BZY81_05740 [SAR202 cluster bacterium Io17-Chloro-G4]